MFLLCENPESGFFNENALNFYVQGVIKTGVSMDFRAFFHPDCYGRYRNCTGSCAEALADYTAGRELHPALKTCSATNI